MSRWINLTKYHNFLANSFDPDQARDNVGPDLDPNCLIPVHILFIHLFIYLCIYVLGLRLGVYVRQSVRTSGHILGNPFLGSLHISYMPNKCWRHLLSMRQECIWITIMKLSPKSSDHHRLAGRWRVDDGPTLYAGSVALWFFRWSGTVRNGTLYFGVFFRPGGGGGPDPLPPAPPPPPPSGSAHVSFFSDES